METRWLSVEEISTYLGVSRDTVYRWIEVRGLPNSGVVFGVSAGTTNVSACTGTICGVVVVTVAP